MLGLIGKKLGHSFSQQYFRQKFQQLNRTEEYALFELQSIEEIPSLLLSQSDLRGFNVTIPYKTAIIPYLDGLSPEALEIQAVNTVKKHTNGKWIGYNTDVLGFQSGLFAFFQPNAPFKALILGTGGAAKAVHFVLKNLPLCTEIQFCGRKTTEMCMEYASLTPALLATFTLIVQTTPLGMYPETETFPLIPYAALQPHQFAMDLVYNPLETVFLQKCAEKGLKTQNGLSMLYEQAEKAWEIWENPM